MKIREPRAGWTWFLWLWGAMFGGVPLAILVTGAGAAGDAPVLLLLLFPTIAVAVLVPMTRRTLRAGFTLAPDGIHGAHDAETTVVPWDQVERIAWRWSDELSGVKVNGRPLPDGYALHAVLTDGRAVRLMQRVAATYGQQQDLNEQLAGAAAAGVLRVPFDATIPTHDGGAWSGTPPSRTHMVWNGDDLPAATDSPLGHTSGVGRSPVVPATTPEPTSEDEPHWPTG